MGQADDIEDLLGKVWGGRYQILEFIGRGGMGMVFKARHLQMDRIVALKVIHRKLCQDEKQVQRFEQEARTSSKLHHPNSIRVYDYGTSDDARLFMAMEFLSGVTLGKLIQNEGPQPPERVIHIARQIIKSLSEAHELGLVHRDLKPENIVICDIYGERDFVKVLDFGIAKAIGPSEEQMNLTQTGFICGTPRYLSPEQALGHEVDGRADLYSVGVLMYEMLTGRPPFIGENPISIVMKHVHDDPPPLTGMEKYGDEGRKITWLVERLLDKNPERRPSPGERIVEYVDGRIDESDLMGRPVSVGFATTDSRGSVAGHPGRGAARDFVPEVSETAPPVSSEAKTIPPVAPLDVHDPAYQTAVLENTTMPPMTPPVPTSDETAMIQRPEVIATRESASPLATAQEELDDEAGETRILNLEELMPTAGEAAEIEVPRIRRAQEQHTRDEQRAPPTQTRPEERAAEPPRRGRPRDPVWAWVSAGLAVAIFALSGALYFTAQDAPEGDQNIEVVAQQAASSPEPTQPKAERASPSEDPASSDVDPAAGGKAPAAPAAPTSAPEVKAQSPAALPANSGKMVGALLAKIELPKAAPEPKAQPKAEPPAAPKPAVAAPAPSAPEGSGAKAPEAAKVASPALTPPPAQKPRATSEWTKKVVSTTKETLKTAQEKAQASRKAEAEKKAAAEKKEAAERRAAERRKRRATSGDSSSKSSKRTRPKRSKPKSAPSFDPF